MPKTNPGPEDSGRGPGRFRRKATTDTRAMDAITGLASRDWLVPWVAEAIEHSTAVSMRAVVAFVDIGQLRDVNDAFGADAGDYLLRTIAARLASIDLPNTRVVRHGGAELALVFEKVPNAEMAEEVARFLLDLLTPGFQLGEDEISITPTVGVAVSADNYKSVEDFVADAHRALVHARENGPGTYALHDEAKRGRYATRIDEARLAKAIEDREFVLAYQPVVRLDTGQVLGFEALLRWESPNATTTGMLLPADFLPLLEKSGMGVRVGHWVVKEACRQMAEWNVRFPDRPALFVSCNVAARQLLSVDFVDTVVTAIETNRVQPWQLCLDITEQALRANRAAGWAALRDLKDRGVRLGLGNFGTGVSSLAYLREFTLDLVRVDRTFIADLQRNAVDQAIVKHVVGLIHELGLVGVAEGIETDEQLAILKQLGMDLGQGYRFGRPAFAQETTQRLDPSAKQPQNWSPEMVTQFKRDWG